MNKEIHNLDKKGHKHRHCARAKSNKPPVCLHVKGFSYGSKTYFFAVYDFGL